MIVSNKPSLTLPKLSLSCPVFLQHPKSTHHYEWRLDKRYIWLEKHQIKPYVLKWSKNIPILRFFSHVAAGMIKGTDIKKHSMDLNGWFNNSKYVITIGMEWILTFLPALYSFIYQHFYSTQDNNILLPDWMIKLHINAGT